MNKDRNSKRSKNTRKQTLKGLDICVILLNRKKISKAKNII